MAAAIVRLGAAGVNGALGDDARTEDGEVRGLEADLIQRLLGRTQWLQEEEGMRDTPPPFGQNSHH